jgi:hypothetical protein
MKRLVTSLAILLSAVGVSAQTPNQLWFNHYRSPNPRVDYGREIKSDAAGNIYVGGHSIMSVVQGHRIIKYDALGNIKWTHLTTEDDVLSDMEVDSAGNVYYAGAHFVNSTHYDILVVKLNTNGNTVWTRTYDGTGNGWDISTSMHLDKKCNIYLTGYGKGPGNGYEILTAKYDSSGQQKWVSQYSGTAVESYQNHGFDVVSDVAGNAYVSGYQYFGAQYALTVLKYDTAGAITWVDTVNTGREDLSDDNYTFSKLDQAGNLYTAGNIMTPTTGNDMLLVKHNKSGNRMWLKSWDSPRHDSDVVCGEMYLDEALAIDRKGNILVIGTIYNPRYIEGQNIATLKYDSSGTLLWTNIFDGGINERDVPFSLTTDSAGNAYICGTSSHSRDLGADDLLVYKLDALSGLIKWQQTYNGPVDLYDEAHAIMVNAKNEVFVTGYSAVGGDAFVPLTELVTIKYTQGSTKTGVEWVKNSTDFSWSAHPNPVDHELSLSFAHGEDVKGIDVLNSVGQRVLSVKKTEEKRCLIPTATLSEGLYFVVVSTVESSYSKKIIVKH